MGSLTDLVDVIEHEANEHQRTAAKRVGIDPATLERDTAKYLTEIRSAVESLDDIGSIDVPETARDAFNLLALSYGSACRELSESVRSAMTTKSAAEYEKAAGMILAIDESRTMNAIIGLRYLNTFYFPDPQMKTYLDSSAELVRRSVELFQG